MSILSQYKQSQNTDFPNIRPSLDLRFALAKKLDPRITFTRGSTGTYFGSDGLMRTAGVNEPRFDHDPVTGQSLGLLIEESRQNLLTYSNDYSASPGGWTLEGTGTRAQDLIGPDGVSNGAWTINDNDTRGDFVRFYKQFSITASSITNYCISSFIKPLSTSRIELYAFFLGSSTKGSLIRYNVLTDTITPFSGDGGGITPSIYGRIVYPNGWIRLYFVVNDANSGANTQLQYRIYPAGRDAGRIGSIGLYGSQIEIGSLPTSYIPTSGSTVTRSADTANITGTNFSSFFNSTEGTLFVDSEMPYQTNLKFPSIGFTRGAGSGNCIEFFYYNTNTPFVQYLVRDSANGGITLVSNNSLNQTVGSYKKFAATYKVGDYNYYFDGKIVARITTNKALPTNLSMLEIGTNSPSGSDRLNGHIRRITYYPIQITNQQLINLTS